MTNINDKSVIATMRDEALQRVIEATKSLRDAEILVEQENKALALMADQTQRESQREKVKEANAKRDEAQAMLSRQQEQLDLLIRYSGPRTNAAQGSFSLPWAIAVAVLAVAAVFFAAFLCQQWLWQGASTAPNSRALIYGTIASIAALLGLTVLALLLRRDQSIRSLTAIGEGVAGIPAERIQEAAKRLDEAEKERAKAEVDRQKAEAAVKAAPDEAAKTTLIADLNRVIHAVAAADKKLQFESQQMNLLLYGRAPTGIGSTIVQYFVFGTLSLIVLMFLMYGIVSQGLLPSLANTLVSRGLITFLIAVVTVTIALILVLATVVSDSADRARRFMQGKEVLTMLIGVLGTIVGFYFGSSTDGVKSLEVVPPTLSSATLTTGEAFDLTANISGGRPPYVFDVVFNPPHVAAVREMHSADGMIHLKGLVAGAVDQNTTVTYRMSVHDSEGRATFFDSAASGKNLEIGPKRQTR